MIPWIVASIAGLLAVGLIIRLGAMMGETNRLTAERDELRRDLKKASDKLDSQQTKYSQAAQEASTKGERAKDQKQRISQLSNDLSKARAETGRLEDRVKELAVELKRVRIDREKMRQEVAAARERLKELGQTAAELEALRQSTAAADDDAPEPAEATPAPARVQDAEVARDRERLERELDKAHGSVERLEAALKRMKKEAVERESARRKAAAKNEHNRRAYIITQLQLDLLTDENYFLKHGKHPDFRQADKQDKRQALKPEPEKIEVDRDAEPIVLPGNEPEPEPEIAAGDDAAEADDDAQEATVASGDEAAAAAAQAAEDGEGDAPAKPDDAADAESDAADAESDAADAKVDAPVKADDAGKADEAPAAKTTVLRKRKDTAAAAAAPEPKVATDRPKAPPRPGS